MLSVCHFFFFSSGSICHLLSCRSVPNIIVIFSASQYSQALLTSDKVVGVQPLQDLAWCYRRRFSYTGTTIQTHADYFYCLNLAT